MLFKLAGCSNSLWFVAQYDLKVELLIFSLKINMNYVPFLKSSSVVSLADVLKGTQRET